MILGPGIFTQNSYAAMWLGVLLLLGVGGGRLGMVYGALFGAAHGVARFVGITRNMSRVACAHPSEVVLSSMRWRFLDGLFLIATVVLMGVWLLGRIIGS